MSVSPSSSSTRQRFIRRRVGAMELLLLPTSGSGLVASQFYLRRGSADETGSENGLASFTAGMLKRGTESRSSAEVALAFESLGAFSSHGAGADATQSSLRCAAADFEPAFRILVDCLQHPAFDSGQLELERETVLAHLMRAEDEKFDFTYREYIKRIFSGHGYGHSPEGEPDDVRAITADHCRKWHVKSWRPENMLFVAAGDIDVDRVCGWLEEAQAGWPSGGAVPPRYAEPAPNIPASSPVELHKPLEQGFQIVGFHTPTLTHEDYPALRLASAALGEGFSGRLFTRLRDERSLAYAVGSSLAANRLCGHMMLYIGTQPERLDEALEGLLAETRGLTEELLPAEDLDRARNYVIGRYLMSHQSLGGRVGFLARWEDAGGGAEQDELYVDRLRGVSARDVREAATRWWTDPTIVTLRPTRAEEVSGAASA